MGEHVTKNNLDRGEGKLYIIERLLKGPWVKPDGLLFTERGTACTQYFHSLAKYKYCYHLIALVPPL